MPGALQAWGNYAMGAKALGGTEVTGPETTSDQWRLGRGYDGDRHKVGAYGKSSAEGEVKFLEWQRPICPFRKLRVLDASRISLSCTIQRIHSRDLYGFVPVVLDSLQALKSVVSSPPKAPNQSRQLPFLRLRSEAFLPCFVRSTRRIEV